MKINLAKRLTASSMVLEFTHANEIVCWHHAERPKETEMTSYIMDNAQFAIYAQDVAKQSAPLAEVEYFNGSLFVTGCSPREASKIQTAFECNGVGVIVTPGAEYSFDFI